jgi:hypothetical protein
MVQKAELTAAEAADLAACQDGPLAPEARRALRHGNGELAYAAGAEAQSRFFDDLARTAVRRRALLRSGGCIVADSGLAFDLASHRRDGLFWNMKARP